MMSRSARRLPWLLSGLLIAALGVGPTDAADALRTVEPSLKVRIDATQLGLGDPFTAVLELRTSAAGDPPRFPDWGESWGAAEIRSVEPIERLDSPTKIATTYRQRLHLQLFQTGEVQLPAVSVVLPGPEGARELISGPVPTLTVTTLLPESESEIEPRAPEPLRRLPIGKRFWWTLAAAGALCLAAGLLLWRKYASEATTEVRAPALPPYEFLRRELAILRSTTDLEQRHVGISIALRRFLGATLTFPALESTSTEIRRRLGARGVPAELVRRTARLLLQCDEVKFARGRPEAAQTDLRIEECEQLGGEIDAAVAPPPAESLEASA